MSYRDFVAIRESQGIFEPPTAQEYLVYANSEVVRLSDPQSFGNPTENDGNYLRWQTALKNAQQEAYAASKAALNISANTLNQFGEATKSISPLLLIGGAVVLGAILLKN